MRFKELRVHAKVPACGSAMAAESFRAAASATEQGGKIAASEWRDVGVVNAPSTGSRGYGRPIDANADAAECGHVEDFWQVRLVGSIAAPTLMCHRTDESSPTAGVALKPHKPVWCAEARGGAQCG